MESKPASRVPETSIVVRTFNEEKHIGNLLKAIGRQKYRNYEIIIVDAGSTDKTLEIAKQFPVTIVQIESRDFTFGYALNIGCQKSRGEYLVFVSAHTLPMDSGWLSQLVAPFVDSRVAMVYGKQRADDGGKFSEQMDLRRIFGESAYNSKVPLDYANNANSAIRKSLWEKRPFDEYLFGLEDIDWARAMIKGGHIVHYEPKAGIYHIHREKWYQVFNRYRREAIAAFRIGLAHPPQVRIGYGWLLVRLVDDVVRSFPNFSRERLEEILRFRYYQWKGSRQGWYKDRGLDFDREKYQLFYPSLNRAVVIRDRGQASIQEVPLPEMKPGDILVQVGYVGICRTDLEVYEGTLGYYNDGTAQYPIVPGHEFSGTIIKIGANADFRQRFKVGQRVVGECIISRKTHNRQEVGVVNYNGAYADMVVVPGDAIHVIPDNVDLQTAALAEPLAVVLRALRRLRMRIVPGMTVAVIGAGPIGNWCAQVLSLQGYAVSVFDKREDRLELLKQHAKKVSTTLRGLDKFDVIVEATGLQDALEHVLKEARVDSTLLLLGFPYGNSQYNFEDVVAHDKVVIGSVGGEPDDFDEALRLLPELDTAPFLKTIMPLESYKEAWEALGNSEHFKILLKP